MPSRHMEQNPYAPPQGVVSDIDSGSASAPSFPIPGGLYTSGQHFVASFLGSPIAAALAAASNYRKLGRERDARKVILWGIAATVVLLGVAYVLPDRFPSSVLPLAYCVGARALAQAAFGDVLTAHRAAGGKPASWWRLIGISLLSLLVLVGVLFAGLFALAYLGAA